MFGGGSYALSAVKEIDGTNSYLKLATKRELCQNKEAVEDCLTNDYIKNSFEKCQCTPYSLRNYSKMVDMRYTLFNENESIIFRRNRC